MYVQIIFFMIRNDFAPKRLSVPRLESKPAPEQTLQKWRLPSKKSKTDPVQALQCNAWEPRQAQHSDPTEEERSLKGAYLLASVIKWEHSKCWHSQLSFLSPKAWQWIPTNHVLTPLLYLSSKLNFIQEKVEEWFLFLQVLWCPHWSWKQHIEADRGSWRTIGSCLRQSGESAFQCSEVNYK